jgi:hypothetical protein
VRIFTALGPPRTARLEEIVSSTCERRTVDSLGVLLDYHSCPMCGFEQFIEAPAEDGSDEGEVTIDGQRGSDSACGACGTAVFIDPVLIWPVRRSRADRADVA